MSETIQYPRIPHDKKKSIKLKLDDIAKIQHLWESGTCKNLKQLAEMFKVTSTTIKYWVDAEYRENRNKMGSQWSAERWRSDPNFRRKKNNLRNEFKNNRYRTDPDFVKYYHSYPKLPDVRNKTRLRTKLWDRSHINIVQKRNLNYRSSHKDKILSRRRSNRRAKSLSAFRAFVRQHA